MKKGLILAFIITAVVASCGKKDGNGSDSTTVKNTSAHVHHDTGAVTSQIMPPQTVNDPIQVTTKAGQQPDRISFSGTFAGPNPNQSVTITGPGGINQTFSRNVVGNNWGAVVFIAPNGGSITVVASNDPELYTNVNSNPNESPNNTGNDVTEYLDGNGNTSTITIVDVGP